MIVYLIAKLDNAYADFKPSWLYLTAFVLDAAYLVPVAVALMIRANGCF